jgi:hypothetical protein
MNKNANQPAFPCLPIQDKFNQLVVPVPGMSKLEHFVLEIYKVHLQNAANTNILPLTICNMAIQDANELLEQLEIQSKPTENETNKLSIIQ